MKVHVNVAEVWAHNESQAVNYDSPRAVAQSEALREIQIGQR